MDVSVDEWSAYTRVIHACWRVRRVLPGPPRFVERRTDGAWTLILLDDGAREYRLSFCGPHFLLVVRPTYLALEYRRDEMFTFWLYTRERWALDEYVTSTEQAFAHIREKNFNFT